MNEGRLGSAAATFLKQTECVYITGGWYNLRTVEKYCPSTNRCSKVASMLAPRYRHAATCVNGKIYVCGGSDISLPPEMYDPVLNLWTYISLMKTVRLHLSLITHNGKIYALGGNEGLFYRQSNEGPDHCIREIEIYHPGRGMWESSFLIPEGFRVGVVI